MKDSTYRPFFRSEHPEENSFWEYLQEALAQLPNNPKPDCHGFYFAEYNHQTGILRAEKIGSIPEEKELKLLYFVTTKVTEALYSPKNRSEIISSGDFKKLRGVCINGHCAGISNHHSLIDEAIATLWLFAKHEDICAIRHKNVWKQMHINATNFQKENAPDNHWIEIIGSLILTAATKMVEG